MNPELKSLWIAALRRQSYIWPRNQKPPDQEPHQMSEIRARDVVADALSLGLAFITAILVVAVIWLSLILIGVD